MSKGKRTDQELLQQAMITISELLDDAGVIVIMAKPDKTSEKLVIGYSSNIKRQSAIDIFESLTEKWTETAPKGTTIQ